MKMYILRSPPCYVPKLRLPKRLDCCYTVFNQKVEFLDCYEELIIMLFKKPNFISKNTSDKTFTFN